MRSLSTGQLKAFSIAGVILGLIPIGIYALWIYAFSQADGYPENVELFKSYFPNWLRGRWDTTYLSLIACVLSMTCCGIGVYLKSRPWRLVNKIFIILSGLLLFLNLWSMM